MYIRVVGTIKVSETDVSTTDFHKNCVTFDGILSLIRLQMKAQKFFEICERILIDGAAGALLKCALLSTVAYIPVLN